MEPVREAAAPRRGRPRRIDGERATERIWAWLTPSERRALEAFAKASGQGIAVILREAVNDFVADSSDRQVFSVTVNSKPLVS